MGNCAGYCITDGPKEEKIKVTVENAYSNQHNVAALKTVVQETATEFEVEYGAQNGGQSKNMLKTGFAGVTQYDSDQAPSGNHFGQGSVYNGETMN